MENQNKDLRFYLAAERTFLAWIRTSATAISTALLLAVVGLAMVIYLLVFR